MSLAKKLVSLRKQKGLTQMDLAERLNVSRQAISRWEVGAAVPSTDNLKILSELYGVSVDDILKGESVFIPQYSDLKTQTEKGKTVQFVSTTGYDYLLDDTTSDVLDGAKLCFVLAVCFSVYFTMEDTSGMMRLILPSPAGKRKVMGYKLLVCCGYLLLVWAAAFFPRLWGSLSIYPMIDGNYIAASLPQFTSLPDGISILEALILMNGSRLLGAVVVTLAIVLISNKIKSPTPVLITSLIILELPAFLHLLGVVGEVLLLPLITGHWMIAG